MQFFGLIFLAIVVEGLITYIKTFFADGKFKWQMLVGIGFGVLSAVAFRVDLFTYVGMESSVPYLGAALTGILISRGSNYVFDLLGKVTDIKKVRE